MLGDDDLDIFFEDFSIPVTFMLDGADVATVDALSNPSTEMISAHQLEIAVSRPEIWCKTAEVSTFGRSHKIRMETVEFRQFGDPLVQGPFTRFLLVK